MTKAIEINGIDVKRFNALVNASRSAGLEFYGKEIAWYANQDETILGVLLLDTIDRDYVVCLLARDEARRYRWFDGEVSLPSIDDAREWLVRMMKWHTGQGVTVCPQGDEGRPINLFDLAVPPEKQHPLFAQLNSSIAFVPARAIINELMPHFVDVDGNFVKEFQTKGFDSRLWELYLNSYFVEDKLFVVREHSSPDFIVKKYGEAIAIEAVIVGRKDDCPFGLLEIEPKERSLEEMEELNRNEIPIRFGSSLFSKLQKEYWKLNHIRDLPLVFAIADFHENQSMLWTSTGLMNYLYGVHHDFEFNKDGGLVIKPQKITVHKSREKIIPSGFFFQPNAENVSAVLFSNSATISKFNRLGRQAGFTHPRLRMMRIGMCHNFDPNAVVAKPFHYEVDESSGETWGEGLSMFHNPRARIPVPRAIFPSIAHHEFKGGQIVSQLPEFHPHASFTMNMVAREEAR